MTVRLASGPCTISFVVIPYFVKPRIKSYQTAAQVRGKRLPLNGGSSTGKSVPDRLRIGV